MSILDAWTCDKTIKAYIVFSVAIAFIIPQDFAIERYLSLDPKAIPYAASLLSITGRLVSLTTYFSVMWVAFPLVFLLLLLRPCEAPTHHRWSIAKIVAVVTLFDIAIILVMAWMMYMPEFEVSPYMSRGKSIFFGIAMYRVTMGLLGGLLMAATAVIFNVVLVRTPLLWRELIIGR